MGGWGNLAWRSSEAYRVVGGSSAVRLSGHEPACPAGCVFTAQMCSHLLLPGSPRAEVTWFAEAVSSTHSQINLVIIISPSVIYYIHCTVCKPHVENTNLKNIFGDIWPMILNK